MTSINGDSSGGVVDEAIAIVGIACRLSGEASSLDGLWDMMSSSRTGHGEVPPDRWDADAWYHPDLDRKGSIAAKSGFFLQQDVALFDASFFSVTPKEAAGLDPQKRLLLEVAYEAFENAGMPMEKLAGTMTGVYVGCMSNDYEILSTDDMSDQPYMSASGSSEAMTANRVSWFFDLRGPSLTIDTACSSSLYALHLACQSLRLRETDVNLVGGVNLILHPKPSVQLTAMHMLGTDGTSHSFDARADGYGRGEGIGSLVVKRLSDAVSDGDVIRAVIRASAANADGQTPSVTMPSAEAQADLIRIAYKRAGLPLHDTQYVEVHGTGTVVGDPIELSAIAATFGTSVKKSGEAESPIYVGSIKPSVGHTEGCAGLADVFRAVLSLEKGYILPTYGVEQLNPKIKLAEHNLALPPEVIPWPSSGQRRASVNCFGFGGANCHVILDDAYHYLSEHGIKAAHSTSVPMKLSSESNTNTETEGDPLNRKRLFVLSAPGKQALTRLIKTYQQYAASNGHDAAENVAYTLAQRRTIFAHRAFAVADSLADIDKELGGSVPHYLRASKLNGLAWVFTGQGAQWSGMGKELMPLFPVFATSIDRSNTYLRSLGCLYDLREELQASDSIASPDYSQPICTALQIALVDLLRDWGAEPKAVAGHSSGEIAACYAAGFLTHQDAIKISYLRGILSLQVSKSPTRKGAMLAAALSSDQANTLLRDIEVHGRVVVACINSPQSVTFSGDAHVISQLEEKLTSQGKFARKLQVSTAYHSHHMQDVADVYLASIRDAQLLPPKESDTGVLMFSSVTGRLVSYGEIDAEYWVRNMCQPVLFSQAVTQMLTYSPKPNRRLVPFKWNSLVEIGPHSALRAPLTQIMESVELKLPKEIAYVSVLQRHEDAATSALKASGTLWALGNPLLLDKINGEKDVKTPPQVVPNLPPYPWARDKRYWYEPRGSRLTRLRQSPRTDLLGIRIDPHNAFEPQWRNYLSARESPWVEDHVIAGAMIYPGAGMLVNVVEALHELAGQNSMRIRGIDIVDVHFDRGLVIPADKAVETLLSIKTPQGKGKDHDGEYTFAFYSTDSADKPWTKHCFGSCYVIPELVSADLVSQDPLVLDWKSRLEELAVLKARPTKRVDVSKFYYELRQNGMHWGESFQNLTSMTTALDGSGCYGTVGIHDTASATASGFEYPHLIHPTTLDSLFHLMVGAIAEEPGRAIQSPAVPYRLRRVFISAQLPSGAGSQFHGYATKNDAHDPDYMIGNMIVSDETWNEPAVVIEGLLMKKVNRESPEGDAGRDDDFDRRRCTRLEWNMDPELFLSRMHLEIPINYSSTVPGLTGLGDWFRLECHKSAGLRVLVDGRKLDAQQVLDQILPWVSGQSLYQGIAQLVLFDVSQQGLDKWQAVAHNTLVSRDTGNVIQYHIWDLESSNPSPLRGQKFDLVVTGETLTADLTTRLLEAMTPPGRLLSLKSDTKTTTTTNGGVYGVTVVNGTSTGQPSLIKRQLSLEQGALTVACIRRPLKTSGVAIILPQTESNNDTVSLVAQKLVNILQERGIPCERLKMDDFARPSHSSTSSTVISLLDVADASFVTNWSAEQFSCFKNMLSSTKHLLWVTRGGQTLSLSPSTPIVPPPRTCLDSAAVAGLFRVLRNEMPESSLIHLDLSPSTASDSPDNAASMILTAMLASASEDGGGRGDAEFAERDNEFFIPRCVPEHGMDEEVALRGGKGRPVHAPLGSVGPLTLDVRRGLLHGIIWQPDNEALLPLEADEAVVRITSISSTVSHSTQPSSAIIRLGEQISGVITQVGSQVTGLAPGDGVLTVARDEKGTLKTHVRRHYSLLLPIKKLELPDLIPPPSAATAWLHMAASHLLTNVIRLRPGETVLIENGTDCLSQAVISAARRAGARVLATVSNDSDGAFIATRYGLDKSEIVNSRTGDLSAYLQSLTGGVGINAMITSNAEFVARKDVPSWMGYFGRVMLVVDDEVDDYDAPSIKLGLKSLSISIVNLRKLFRDDTRFLQKQLEQAPTLLREAHDISPVTVISLSKLEDVSRFLEMPDKEGGILVIECSDDSIVPVAPPEPKRLELDGQGTYLLAGGLGEIGIRIANLMAWHGARHIVLLSRSGSKPKYDRDLHRISTMGCRVDVLRCDVTSLQDCQGVAEGLRAEGKVIRGLVQCAMVLADSILENMTYAQWQAAFSPKVVGTWNLHSVLPEEDLEFFIMLSSVVAIIGNISQTNYSAGNTWMDGLAHYRRARGTRGSKGTFSINAGAVFATDHVVNGASLLDGGYLDRYDHMVPVSTTLEEIDACLEACMRQGCMPDDVLPELPAQLVLGMTDGLPVRHDQWTADPKFVHRLEKTSVLSSVERQDGDKTPLAQTLAASTSLQEVTSAIINLLSSWLGVDPADVSPDKPLFSIGLDSFKAVEIKNHVFHALQSEISVFEMLSASPMAEIANIIALRSPLVPPEHKSEADGI